MSKYKFKILKLNVINNKKLNVEIEVKGSFQAVIHSPKIALFFDNGKEVRRIPMLVKSYYPKEDMDRFILFGENQYLMDYLFFHDKAAKDFKLYFEFIYGNDRVHKIPFEITEKRLTQKDENNCYEIKVSEDHTELIFHNTQTGNAARASMFPVVVSGLWKFLMAIVSIGLLPVFLIESILVLFKFPIKSPAKAKIGSVPRRLFNHTRWRCCAFCNMNLGLKQFRLRTFQLIYKIFCKRKIKENRILFLSNRRDDLSGNLEFVYDVLKEKDDLEFVFLLDSEADIRQKISVSMMLKLAKYLATSKVILVDDYYFLLYRIGIRKETKLFQLWHACGAFKTFGFSRARHIQKLKQQRNSAHRNYDYTIVSSKEIADFYAEGFGISVEKAKPTGIPRTDIFFQKEYKEKKQKEFYDKYPQFKDKKILMFAPTFRGEGKISGHYPVERFNLKQVYEALGGEYAIIVKHHPFVQDRNEIPEEYKNDILDLSEEAEINDLLFVTDLLVTDYSSVIFEASLLDIPMLFYAYDLHEYISSRGFYYEYELFVPGKIVQSERAMLKALEKKDFEEEKIAKFKTRFFDDLDGKSSERVGKLILDSMKE